MDRTTDRPETSCEEIAAFYDGLASDFDGMTDTTRRFVRERPFFRILVERYGIGTAVDAGCGTGFHSVLLAKLGVAVTAVDLSQKMLDHAGRNAQAAGVAITFARSSFQNLSRTLTGRFDAIFSLGNSLAHLLTREQLVESLRSFASVLRPGGLVFLQTLNYERVLRTRERIQNIREHQGVLFIRYYEYGPETIQFHILKVRRAEAGVTHTLSSVDLRPWLKEELVAALTGVGFGQIKTFGGISMESYHHTRSKDLVILAQTGEQSPG